MKIESTFSFDASVITSNGTERILPKSDSPIRVVNGVATNVPDPKDGTTFLVSKKVYDDNPNRGDFAMWDADGKFDDPADGKTKYRSAVTRNGIFSF